MSAPPARPRGPEPSSGARTLRRFTTPREPAQERCELCGVPVAEGAHHHLVDTDRRALACACVPCAMLFDQPGAGSGRFRTVPDRYLVDRDHALDDRAWDLLQIPVSVAFFFRNAQLDRLVAQYPSPAGATESELSAETWETVLGGSLLARELAPDTEALLLRRSDGRVDCYLVPIDICYELVGRMRLLWQGFDGGAEARADLNAFFTHIEDRAEEPAGERRP